MTHGDLIGADVPMCAGHYSANNVRNLLFEDIPDGVFYEWLDNAVKNNQAIGADDDIYVSLLAVNALERIVQNYY